MIPKKNNVEKTFSRLSPFLLNSTKITTARMENDYLLWKIACFLNKSCC